MRITSALGMVAITLSQMGGCPTQTVNNDTVLLAVTQRVSLSTAGAEPVGVYTGNSFSPAISDEGRYAAFVMDDKNMHPDDTSNNYTAFVRDVEGKRTILVPRATGPSGTVGASTSDNSQIAISADGQYVAFETQANLDPADTNSTGLVDIYVRNIFTNTTILVSRANGVSGTVGNNFSLNPSISSDGRYVAFESDASNLVGGIDGNSRDIFVRDLKEGTTTLVSIPANGTPINADTHGPSISPEGSAVAFYSQADFLGGDTNGKNDIYIRKNWNGTGPTTELVSRNFSGGVASFQGASNGAQRPSVSSNGRFVAFEADFSDMVPNDINSVADIFVRDTQANTTVLASVHTKGTQSSTSSALSGPASLSADGLMVVFESSANNLVDDDINGQMDVFVRDLQQNLTRRVSIATYGAEALGGESRDGSIARDGKFVVFMSKAVNLVTGDTNGVRDFFIRGPLK